MTYGCKIMVSLTLCRFYGPPCRSMLTLAALPLIMSQFCGNNLKLFCSWPW